MPRSDPGAPWVYLHFAACTLRASLLLTVHHLITRYCTPLRYSLCTPLRCSLLYSFPVANAFLTSVSVRLVAESKRGDAGDAQPALAWGREPRTGGHIGGGEK